MGSPSTMDTATIAFRRVLSEASAGEQSRVDALVILAQRTLYSAIWPGPNQVARTLTNSDGETALPLFTGLDALESTATRFGWRDPDGSLQFRQLGARDALRHALARGVHFVVIDIGTEHSVEFAREELEPLLSMQSRHISSGPFAGSGEPQASILEAVRRVSSRPVTAGRPGSPVPPPAAGSSERQPPSAKRPASAPQTGQARPPSVRPPPALAANDNRGPSATRARMASAELPLGSSVRAEVAAREAAGRAGHDAAARLPGVTREPPSRPPSKTVATRGSAPTRSSAPAAAPQRTSAPAAATQRTSAPATPQRSSAPAATPQRTSAPAATPQRGSAPAAPSRSPSGGVATREADSSQRPPTRDDLRRHKTLSPPKALLAPPLRDSIANSLRAFPEVEWACVVSDDSEIPLIGVRVDPSYLNRVTDITDAILDRSDEQGVELQVLLLNNPDLVKSAHKVGQAIYPWLK